MPRIPWAAQLGHQRTCPPGVTAAPQPQPRQLLPPAPGPSKVGARRGEGAPGMLVPTWHRMGVWGLLSWDLPPQMPRKPKRGTSRRRSGVRNGPSTWVWAGGIGRDAGLGGSGEPRARAKRESGRREAGAKELCRVAGNPISCHELSPGRSCCAGGSAPQHGSAPPACPCHAPPAAPCRLDAPWSVQVPPAQRPALSHVQAAAGSPAAARGGGQAGPPRRAWGLLVPALFPPSFPHCLPARSAGSRPPFCPGPNPSLADRPRCRLPRAPSEPGRLPRPAHSPVPPPGTRIPMAGLPGAVPRV